MMQRVFFFFLSLVQLILPHPPRTLSVILGHAVGGGGYGGREKASRFEYGAPYYRGSRPFERMATFFVPCCFQRGERRTYALSVRCVALDWLISQ